MLDDLIENKDGITLIKDPYGHRLTNGSDIELRYGGSIVMVGNKPHLVAYQQGRTTWQMVDLAPFDKKEGDFLSSRKTSFNIIANPNHISTDFDLGWGEYPVENPQSFSSIYYIERIPTRRYKQGLTTNNTALFRPLMKDNVNLQLDPASNNIIVLCLLLEHTAELGKVDILKRCKDFFAFGTKHKFQTGSNYGFVLNSKVACCMANLDKNTTWENFFVNVLVEQACIGKYYPSIESFQINREGLYSVFEEDLTSAGILKH